MTDRPPLLDRGVGPGPALAVVLGTNDIASAIGWRMARAGWGVLLLRDLDVAVLRRGMAFDDALEDGAASLDGVVAVRAVDPAAAAAVVASAGGVAVGRFGVGALIAARVMGLDALVDARMHKYAEREDLQPLATCAVGVGPGFVAGSNVHVAVESLPGAEGAVVAAGPTASPTGKAIPLGGAGAERFVYAPLSGPWVAEAALGVWVEAGQRIGRISGVVLEAPLAGTIRGLVRSSPHGIVRGTKLLEIDPRRGALWRGIAPRPGRIAAGVAEALGASGAVGLVEAACAA